MLIFVSFSLFSYACPCEKRVRVVEDLSPIRIIYHKHFLNTSKVVKFDSEYEICFVRKSHTVTE